MENCASGSTSSLTHIPTITLDSDEEKPSSVILVKSSDSSLSEDESDTSVKSVQYVFSNNLLRSKTPGNYYLKRKNPTYLNFASALVNVQHNRKNWHLFTQDDANIFSNFAKLSIDAQKLYVFMINGSHSWYRVSTLPSDNCRDVSVEVNDLTKEEFITSDSSSEYLGTLIKLLSLSEIKSVCRKYNLDDSVKKEKLVKSLLEYDGLQINQGKCTIPMENSIYDCLGTVVKLTEEPRKLFLSAMILHSLPHAHQMRKDGRTPILSVMDLVSEKLLVYPEHPVSRSMMIYPSRISFERFKEALELNLKIKTSTSKNKYGEVVTKYKDALRAFKGILADSQMVKNDKGLALCLRTFTAGSVLAEAVDNCMEGLRVKRKFEEMVQGYQTLLSQDVYLAAEHGKWYDQLAATHMHLKDIPRAIEVLTEALTDKSLNPVYRVLLSNRGLKVAHHKFRNKELMEKVKFLRSMLVRVRNPPTVEIKAKCVYGRRQGTYKLSYVLESDAEAGPMFTTLEDAVIHHYKKLGFDEGLNGGDALSISIFGTFFWDILYTMEAENVYISPYQSQPLDLHSGDFYRHREEAVKKRINDMTEMWSIQDMKDFVNIVWREEGKESLVSWGRFGDKNKFQNLMESIGLSVLSKICKRLAKEFPVGRRGFPGVTVWNPKTKKVKFFTVKSKNGSLSAFECSWLAYLNVAGADAALCQTEISGTKHHLPTSRRSGDSHTSKQQRSWNGLCVE